MFMDYLERMNDKKGEKTMFQEMLAMSSGNGGGYKPFTQATKDVLNGSNTYTFSGLSNIKSVFVAYDNVACFAYFDDSNQLVVNAYYTNNWKITAISGNQITLYSSYAATNTKNIKFYIQEG